MNATTNADSQEELEAFIEYYANTLVFNYADLAVFVVLVFEFLITFDREVHFAWGRKLSWARTIFLMNRYLSILEYLVVLGPLLPTLNYFAFQVVLYVVWAGFAGWRVYAISGRNSILTTIVVLLAVVPAVTNAYVTTCTTIALSELGCMSGMNLSILTWIDRDPSLVSVATRSCMILSDALVIIITWVKTWGTMRAARKLHVQMSFTSLILKEGVLYFVIMLSLNIVQIIFDFQLIGTFGFIVPFLNVITPILISRFFLDLDDLNVQEASGQSRLSASRLQSSRAQSTMRFVTPSSTDSDHMRPSLVYGGDNRVSEVGADLPEKSYPVSATW
ncbi:hypothetical protein L227DRAFT_570117 [Lentinus tigrinus ALCF2SS1-6]|uniref:DUF6533 domain-containing protein n=1 Tax=Lentinus tigrinus ALCF2SS1-6 TaxID=1328759 RepID=A0A5C2SRZ9_9APHY|nr:hypothetical protein L227DRAFT_570117 [Lentinus tigrinus ALCF2SS1-6]